MIHSIIPVEDLFFAGWEDTIGELQEITYGGVTMQVQPEAGGQARIVRLISGNPHDYMNQAFMPGNTIRFVPKFD